MLGSFKLLATALLYASVAGCSGDENAPSGSGSGGGGGGSGGSGGGTPAGSSAGGSLATAGSMASGGTSPSAGDGNAGGKAGGSSAGASGSSDVGGSSGAGGSVSGAHCSPGAVQDAGFFFNGVFDQCESVEGVPEDIAHVVDIQLLTPIGPGQNFAFSVGFHGPPGDFDVYGATSECGKVGEKLSTVHIDEDGIICHEVKPVTGTYSHLIWAWHVNGEMLTVAYCESGTCSAQR
jgi:hypothetical protein